MPTPRTVRITNPDLLGAQGARRVPFQVINFAGTTVEVMVPKGWFPSRRAGVGPWELVSQLASTGTKFYQARLDRAQPQPGAPFP